MSGHRPYRRSMLAAMALTAALSAGAKGMNPIDQDNTNPLKRFALGQQLGRCLTRGCVVFSASIVALGRSEKAPGEVDPERATMLRTVDVKVLEWLYRKDIAAASPDPLRLQHAAPPALSKTGLGPWTVWDGVHLEVGGPLLVARWTGAAQRPTWFDRPEDVGFATSDPALFASVREVTAQQRRFERDPHDVTVVARRMREKNDPLFSAYLLTYLTDHEAVRDVDRAASLLGSLIGQATPPGRTLIADWLASSFYRLAKTTRKELVDTLLAAAAGDDAGSAAPALRTLIRLGDQKLLELPASLTGPTRQKIVEAYRAQQASDKAAHPEFEWQLGLR